MLTADTRRALAAREAAPLAPPGYDCCGCTEGATVATPDGLCDDCGPRYADAGEHLTACRCGECGWWHEVSLRREARSEDAEVCL